MQSAFRSGHSAEKALIRLTDQILNNMDNDEWHAWWLSGEGCWSFEMTAWGLININNIICSFAFSSPVSPDAMDWHSLFPAFFPEKVETDEIAHSRCSKVEFADIGCGYGGLLGGTINNAKWHVFTLC